jgi:histidine triad (HIT) family protein
MSPSVTDELCILCRLVRRELPISLVYEDTEILALMDIQPVNPGHLLVIPKTHIPYLSGLDDRMTGRLMMVGRRLAAAIRRTSVRCEGINLFLADGEAAGQEIFHTHLHVFPRYRDDGFGLKFAERYFTRPHRSELDAVAGEVRAQLATRT